MKHFLFRYYSWIALIAFVLVGILAAASGKAIDWRIFLLSLGTILSFVYFMQRQKLEELKLFKKLFTEFNKRYDELNEGLNRIIGTSPNAKLTRQDRDLLYDYFNLCGEEYLFYKQGYIYPEVWKAWRNGMQIYFRNKRVKKLWGEELKTGSYYGLRLD